MEGPPQDGSSFERALRFDEICDRFEMRAKAGQRGIFDEYLGEVDEAERRDLFQELLTIELESRSRLQEQVTPEEYLARYPAFRPQIGAAFSSLQSPSASAAARPFADSDASPHEYHPPRHSWSAWPWR